MPQASVTTTPSQIFRESAGRKLMLFKHTGTTGIIYLSSETPGAAQIATAFWELRAGEAVSFSAKGPYAEKLQQRIVAFSSAGTITLRYDESFGEDTQFDVALMGSGQVVTQATQAFEVSGVAENTQGLTGKGPFTVPRSHYGEETWHFDSDTIAASTTGVSEAQDISDFARVSINIRSTAAVTLRYQLSEDAINWYDPVNEGDTLLTYAISPDAKNIAVDRHGKYLRLQVTNAGAGAAVVTAVVQGQA